ncbi:hypothetical protein [Paraburkholderia sp. RL17-337-BIB-A]|uniref:hypothetical protein n=1 Tax=Paraburkholderia sp. RL17-337-BIB-A TaxID=3031636 RepID=UPI0038BDD8DA
MVNEKLLSAHGSIVDALKCVDEYGSEQEIQAFRAGAAHVAGHMFSFLLRPLWQEHLELAPEGLDMSRPPKRKGKR